MVFDLFSTSGMFLHNLKLQYVGNRQKNYFNEEALKKLDFVD